MRNATSPVVAIAARRVVAGGIYFATESPVWTGGRAFYDPELRGRAAMRSCLVTAGRFSDIAAQEMYRDPGVVGVGSREEPAVGRLLDHACRRAAGSTRLVASGDRRVFVGVARSVGNVGRQAKSLPWLRDDLRKW